MQPSTAIKSVAQRIFAVVDASPGWTAAILTIAAATSAVITPSWSFATARVQATPVIAGGELGENSSCRSGGPQDHPRRDACIGFYATSPA